MKTHFTSDSNTFHVCQCGMAHEFVKAGEFKIMSDSQLDLADLPNDWASIPIGTKDQWLVGHIDAPEIKAWRESHGFERAVENDGQPD